MLLVESFIDLMHSVQFRNDFFAWKIQNKIAALYSDSKKYLDVEVMLKNVWMWMHWNTKCRQMHISNFFKFVLSNKDIQRFLSVT